MLYLCGYCWRARNCNLITYIYVYEKKNLKANYGWCKVELHVRFQINRKISKWNLHISWKEVKRKRNNESWIQIQRAIQNLDLLKCLQLCVTENLDFNFHNSKSCHFRQSKCWIFNLLKIPHLLQPNPSKTVNLILVYN